MNFNKDTNLGERPQNLEEYEEDKEVISVLAEELSKVEINRDKAFSLYPKSQQPAEKGDKTRITLQHTIRPQTDKAWRDFLETYSGSVPQRGKGISSVMVELSMRITMAIIADFEIEEVGDEIASILSHKNTYDLVAKNINKLAFAVFAEKSVDESGCADCDGECDCN